MKQATDNFPHRHTGHKLNIKKTFRRHPGHLLNILFKFRTVSTGFNTEHFLKENHGNMKKDPFSVSLLQVY